MGTDRFQQRAEWDGICLLGICAGALSYNWLAETGVCPETYRAWIASLTAFPWVLVSLVNLARVEDEAAWMEQELELGDTRSDDSRSGARAA